MTKHTPFTPGPWLYDSTWGLIHDGRKTARNPHESAAEICAIHAGRTGNKAETEANAHLIAAAPDMLAALEVLVGWESASLYEKDAIRNFDRARGCKNTRSELSDEILSLARAAIAKARGEA